MESSPSLDVNALLLTALRQPVPLWDVKVTTVTGGLTFERLQLADSVLSLLMDTADFRERARSYRGFNVGAGARVIRGPTVGKVLGYNVKVDETDLVNIHAEDLVSAKSQDMGFEAMAVVAVIGPAQPDKVSGVEMLTLPPCGQRCRPMFNTNPMIRPDTLFVSALPNFTAIELYDIDGLNRAQDEGDMSGITSFTYDQTPDVFRPLPPPDKHGFAVIEEVDDTDWQETVGSWLIQRFAEHQAL